MNKLPREDGRKSNLNSTYLLSGGVKEDGRNSNLTPSYLLSGGDGGR